ncbi:MAG: hypothetical protein EOQ46_12825 [Mesorhizobium sp.]|uniref:5-methylcytosine restriction system specificity protein McrC n=1 Tax=Mesorhizobium sp. TaxID=1871066 RepID=UPI000FE65392|nr:hypothetical protein [Mesorhizobium sp.]RWB44793.1 MAG: hypothetical protein EOQ46_12825 [Mesorhizobium sp.]
MIDIIDCQEFGVIELGIDRLLVNGEIALDSRIVEKGFLNFSLVKGQVVFRADKHVGLIPLNDRVAIRVRPRAAVANIAHMIVKSGIAPFAIPDFSRGYLPNFEAGPNVERVYCGPLASGLERVVAGGLMKSYVSQKNPPPWRGRLLVSDTIRRHRARNVRYMGEFEFKTLSHSGPENIALKHAAKFALAWLMANDRKSLLISRMARVIGSFDTVPDFEGYLPLLLQQIARSAAQLPSHYSYYRDPLWTAYLILQGKVPDLVGEGFVTLDSLIVDLSRVFEAYIRRVLADRATARNWRIVNGEDLFYPFFSDGDDFRVKPDIVIVSDGSPVAILDAKYKLEPKESDRYEVLSFMDALGVQRGGFVSPLRPGDSSVYLGTTSSGKALSSLRFDLAAQDLEAEADRFVSNVAKLVDGKRDFV